MKSKRKKLYCIDLTFQADYTTYIKARSEEHAREKIEQKLETQTISHFAENTGTGNGCQICNVREVV